MSRRNSLINRSLLVPYLIIVLIVSPIFAIAQEAVYFGNLHSHTSLSDGVGTPREAYRYARDTAKLDFLAITEHNHSQAQGSDNIGIATNTTLYNGGPNSLIATARSLTVGGRFVALYGQEYSVISRGNHVNVFEVPQVITAPNGRFDRLVELLAATSDSVGRIPIVMLNHPRNTSTIQPDEYGLDDFGSDQLRWVRSMGTYAALIQMINGPGQRAGVGMRASRPAESAYKKFLSLGFKLAPTADQDNHKNNWGNATNARTAVIATALSREAILEGMRNRHVYASEDKNLRIIIKVNGRLCGDVIPALASPSEAKITYSIRDSDEPNAKYEIQVWRGTVGGPLARLVSAVTVSQGSGSIEDVALSGNSEFFFFKIIQSNGAENDEDDQEDEAWTSPVWFELEGSVPSSDTTSIANSIASRHSKIYHVSSDCLDAKRIKPANRILGASARDGRVRHDDCPRLSNR